MFLVEGMEEGRSVVSGGGGWSKGLVRLFKACSERVSRGQL